MKKITNNENWTKFIWIYAADKNGVIHSLTETLITLVFIQKIFDEERIQSNLVQVQRISYLQNNFKLKKCLY